MVQTQPWMIEFQLFVFEILGGERGEINTCKYSHTFPGCDLSALSSFRLTIKQKSSSDLSY